MTHLLQNRIEDKVHVKLGITESDTLKAESIHQLKGFD
jgi:hypothetical protein